jgi:hypothetical protein
MTNAPRRRRSRRPFIAIAALGLAAVLVGVAAVQTNTLGAGNLFDRAVAKVDRFMAGPVPDRSAPVTVVASDDPSDQGTDPPDDIVDESAPPDADPSSSPTPTAAATTTPGASPTAKPAPTPARVAVDVDIVKNHDKVFAHEIKDTWCASAGVQMVLAIHKKGDTSHAFQRELQGRVREWESYKDSHNGDWGPSAMALALDAYGVKGYEVRGYKTRQGALRGAAKAIEKTGSPVLLLAWRGAHTWVMTGFKADADPALFTDATVKGTYILDPWYPDVSSIWGPSDPPGTYQNTSEMERNYLKWKRPEGLYPERDGLYIAVVPTVVVKPVS